MPGTIHIKDVITSPLTVLAISATMEETLEPNARLLYEDGDSYTTAASFFEKGNIVIFNGGADVRFFHSTKHHPAQFLTLEEYILAQGKAAQLAAFFEKHASK